MSLSYYPSSSKVPSRTGATEFEILKASHKFLHDEDDTKNNQERKTWNEQLAEKYYASLYREFAVCDLKHYKSGNFALRWRTEDEVLSGAGESTCGNTRCKHHHPLPSSHSRNINLHDPDVEDRKPNLVTMELPFAYREHGEYKSALVKMVLCERCMRKMMWKRQKEKGGEIGSDEAAHGNARTEEEKDEQVSESEDGGREEKSERKHRRRENQGKGTGKEREKRKENSRSRSPRRITGEGKESFGERKRRISKSK